MSIERLEFGRTGHRSSRVIFGAAALGGMNQERADETLARLLPAGVNHIDTAAAYGASEERLAPWLAAHRREVFLATKTGDRDGDSARRSLERSLQRLGVDHVDLIQLHNLVESDEWEAAHGPHGALHALVTARAEGLTRFIGVTGHGTRIAAMHLRSLDAFDYDSVLLPYNFTMLQLNAYRSDVETLLARCAERGVAVQTIKSLARRRWPDDHADRRYSWYEPVDHPDAIERAVRYVLARPGLFLNTSSDARLLDITLAAAAGAGDGPGPSDEEMASDTDRWAITPLFTPGELERI
jgi:aryl-alcohol dehydrogenase-like predicted oxidoreductase